MHFREIGKRQKDAASTQSIMSTNDATRRGGRSCMSVGGGLPDDVERQIE